MVVHHGSIKGSTLIFSCFVELAASLVGALPVLQDKYRHHDSNQREQAEDALERPRALLVLLSLLQLLNALLRVLHDLLHVEVDPVENCTLVDNEYRELLENAAQLLNALRNVLNLLVALAHDPLEVVDHGQLLLVEAAVAVGALRGVDAELINCILCKQGASEGSARAPQRVAKSKLRRASYEERLAKKEGRKDGREDGRRRKDGRA